MQNNSLASIATDPCFGFGSESLDDVASRQSQIPCPTSSPLAEVVLVLALALQREPRVAADTLFAWLCCAR
ncbi:hypothetical protein NXS19_012237 [Fusarium pseudograminearum]|nr:hypothetical protein NXS19_012237 [Fusarium pseudograminearum]